MLEGASLPLLSWLRTNRYSSPSQPVPAIELRSEIVLEAPARSALSPTNARAATMTRVESALQAIQLRCFTGLPPSAVAELKLSNLTRRGPMRPHHGRSSGRRVA